MVFHFPAPELEGMDPAVLCMAIPSLLEGQKAHGSAPGTIILASPRPASNVFLWKLQKNNNLGQILTSNVLFQIRLQHCAGDAASEEVSRVFNDQNHSLRG